MSPNPFIPISGGSWMPLAGGRANKTFYNAPNFGGAPTPQQIAAVFQPTPAEVAQAANIEAWRKRFPAVQAMTRPAAFAHRYNDPVYDMIDAQTAQATGVPLGALRAVRLAGERSNADQVSSAGARTPYQFTPETRARFVKRGIDPWRSPQEASMAAAIHLKEDAERFGGNYAAAVAGYNGGQAAARAVAEGRAPPAQETRDYLQRVMGMMGGAGGYQQLPTGFDPSVYNGAMGTLQQAQAAAMQPFEATFGRVPMPEAPAPFDAPTRDFSAQDQIIADMAPRAFDAEAEGPAIQRRRIWQGAAQALASLNDSSGVGTILARVGAGMLGGRMAADDEIQARIDKYDEQMQQYNALRYRHEDNKAQAKLEEATLEAQSVYDLGLKKWGAALQDWQQNNTVDVQGGNLIVQRTSPNGSLAIQSIPLPNLVLPPIMMQQAQLQTHVADAQNAATTHNAGIMATAIASTATDMARATVAQEFAGTGTDPGVAMATATASYAATAASIGKGPELMPDFDPESGTSALWDKGLENAKRQALQMGHSPGTKEFAEAVQTIVAGNLTAYIMDPKTGKDALQRLQGMAPSLAGIQRAGDKRVVKQQGGKTTITTTEEP